MPAVKTDCEGGGGEAKATESVADIIEQSGQHSSSLSNSAQSEEKLVENCGSSVGDDRFEFGIAAQINI